MLICKKDFQQYKKGDKLPQRLDINVIRLLIKDGLAEYKDKKSARITEYTERIKKNPKKNYIRKKRAPNKPKGSK